MPHTLTLCAGPQQNVELRPQKKPRKICAALRVRFGCPARALPRRGCPPPQRWLQRGPIAAIAGERRRQLGCPLHGRRIGQSREFKRLCRTSSLNLPQCESNFTLQVRQFVAAVEGPAPGCVAPSRRQPRVQNAEQTHWARSHHRNWHVQNVPQVSGASG